MHSIIVIGAGKIGATAAHLLANSGDYKVSLIDINFDYLRFHLQDAIPSNLELIYLDIHDQDKLKNFLRSQKNSALLSCLPYFCNPDIAKIALEFNLHYFDLSEDTENTDFINKLSGKAKTAFVPQCGLAPGFIDIVANDVMQYFDKIEDVKLRCGALPVNASNALQYALTWSVDGLINEYGNPCHAVEAGQEVLLSPLENLEEIQINGLNYEAFNTSGGIGSLAETYQGKVTSLNYKTMRYPGHCEKMRFLMQGLKLNNDRETLKKILLKVLPYTEDDVVIVYVSATGMKNKEFTKKSYVNRFYPKVIAGVKYSAIQITTATCACAVIDIVLNDPTAYEGQIKQEQFKLKDILSNQFGQYLKVNSHDRHTTNAGA